MKKALVAVVAVLVVIIGTTYYFLSGCNQPEDIQVQVSTLICAQGVNQDVVFEEVCQKSHGQSYPCELVSSDERVFYNVVGDKINDCVSKDMKKQNLCTDKIKRF